MVEEVAYYCFDCRRNVSKKHAKKEAVGHKVVVLGRHIPTAKHRKRIAALPSIDRYLVKLTIPAQYDLRNVNGVNYCPPVGDQGQEGACTGWGAYVFMGTHKRISGTWLEDISQRYVYTDAKNREGDPCAEGAYMIDIMDALQQDGVCRSHYWPYTDDFDCRWPCPDPDGTVDALDWKIASFADCATATDPITAIKIAIMMYGSIDMGTPWGQSWMDAWPTGVMPVPPDNDTLVGGHSWDIIGWDDTLGVFICQNSWGTGNAMGGYFTIPYATLTCAFWQANGGYEAYSAVDAPSIDCPVGQHYDPSVSQCVPDSPIPPPPPPDPITCITDCFVSWDQQNISDLIDCIVGCIMNALGYSQFIPLVNCIINCIVSWDGQDYNELLDCVIQCLENAGRTADAEKLKRLLPKEEE
jgi:hypothetical protein